MTTITGKIESAAGETLHAKIYFTSQSTPQFPPTIVQVNTVKRVLSDADDGTFSVQLAAGNYAVRVSAKGLDTNFHIAVPDGSSTISIEDLVTTETAALPGEAPYTVWNGSRAGHITFVPVAEPAAPTLSAVVYTGGHQGGTDLFSYVVVWVTTEGTTIGSADAVNTPPSGSNNATRVTLPSPPSRVTSVQIYRSTDDSTTNRYLLATVTPETLYYDDWEDTADFNARLNALEIVPLYNTSAGIINASPDNPILYFSTTGLRCLVGAQFDQGLTAKAALVAEQAAYFSPGTANQALQIYLYNAPTKVGLKIRAADGQTANLQEWCDLDNTPVSYVDADGKLVLYALQVLGGSPSAGKVLTSDASGNATWQAASGGGGAAGAGSPEGVLTASPGQTYLNTTDESVWWKKTGTGNTGWIQKME